MNLTLTPIFDEEARALAAEDDASQIPLVRDFFETADLADSPKLTIDHAVDANGRVYRQLHFMASARWHDEAGDTWLSGAGFQFNATTLVDQIESIVTASQDVRP